MSVNFDALLASAVNDIRCHYRDSDAISYALGVGFCSDDAAPRELDYVYEGHGLRTVPTMAGVLLDNDFLAASGWNPVRIATTEQKLELYRPLPASAELRADRRVVAVLDHGLEVGASVMIESEVRMAKDGTVLFTLANTLLAGGRARVAAPPADGPLPHRLPGREADLVCRLQSTRAMPYQFRLGAERSPLYADPATAQAFGYPATPLHEQCIAGMACRAILQTICEYDFTLVCGMDLRFTGTLYPGDTLVTEMWQERNIVSFRSTVAERDEVVIDNGKCVLAV